MLIEATTARPLPGGLFYEEIDRQVHLRFTWLI